MEYEAFHCNENNIFLRVDLKVLQLLDQFRQKSIIAHEAGGVLIGYVFDNKAFWIKDITYPYSKDYSSRTKFIRQDSKHQEKVERLHNESSGTLQYLGEWHTHPEKKPSPSSIDYKSWKNLNHEMKPQMRDQPFIFVILSDDKSQYDWISLCLNDKYFIFNKLTN